MKDCMEAVKTYLIENKIPENEYWRELENIQKLVLKELLPESSRFVVTSSGKLSPYKPDHLLNSLDLLTSHHGMQKSDQREIVRQVEKKLYSDDNMIALHTQVAKAAVASMREMGLDYYIDEYIASTVAANVI